MKVSVTNQNLLGFAVYVSVLFTGSYYLGGNFKNLQLPLLGAGGAMTVGGGVLTFVKK
ncbi:hypothetical protein [Fischerella sp. PCC 9605]|uniref:hypothetical protein n=1 Tax=Fischerella sp. PCC 9605 TaxID=1173024 RepID=UPI0004BB97C4|nr:hypothetical protein [Fischerella sp. PCC 9605]